MQELVPVVVGIAVGTLIGPSSSRRAAGGALAASLVLGVLVAWAVGELTHSMAYAILDAGVIVCTAVIVMVARRVARRTDEGHTQGGAAWLRTVRTTRM